MSMLIGIAIVTTSILFIIYKSKGQNSKDSISSFQKQALEAANLKCQEKLWWLPTLIKVYLIGILETIYIAVYKRGLFPSSITKEENEAKVSQLIDRYLESHKQDNQQPIAVITGGDSGIGLEITKSLKRCGFELIIGLYDTISRSKSLIKLAFQEQDPRNFARSSLALFLHQKVMSRYANLTLLILALFIPLPVRLNLYSMDAELTY